MYGIVVDRDQCMGWHSIGINVWRWCLIRVNEWRTTWSPPEDSAGHVDRTVYVWGDGTSQGSMYGMAFDREQCMEWHLIGINEWGLYPIVNNVYIIRD